MSCLVFPVFRNLIFILPLVWFLLVVFILFTSTSNDNYAIERLRSNDKSDIGKYRNFLSAREFETPKRPWSFNDPQNAALLQILFDRNPDQLEGLSDSNDGGAVDINDVEDEDSMLEYENPTITQTSQKDLTKQDTIMHANKDETGSSHERAVDTVGTRVEVDESKMAAIKGNNSTTTTEHPEDVLRERLLQINTTSSMDYLHLPPDHQLGYLGRAVKLNLSQLSAGEMNEYKDGQSAHGFNQFTSDRISMHRKLPYIGDKRCENQTDIANLPSTSIIMCFCNEALSVLLRSIHGVIDNTPQHLLGELLLVDDFSDKAYLKFPLEEYLAYFPKVKLVRTGKREGLIRARLLGVSKAQYPIHTFLDSHVEVTPGWLEPLISRVSENWKNVVTPVITILNGDDFRLVRIPTQHILVGGFNWDLDFQWIAPNKTIKPDESLHPIWSPTMAGGLFSIHRKFFDHLGAYDPEMEFWGGENLELSFKIWMCGGTIEVSPCSVVGHIFRKKSPIQWNSNKITAIMRNLRRVAEVWMDDYKQLYFQKYFGRLVEFGDVTSRRALRESLQCHSFEWYLKKVYPRLSIPPRNKLVQIKSRYHRLCLEGPEIGEPVVLAKCSDIKEQIFIQPGDKLIVSDIGCLESKDGRNVIINTCLYGQATQSWIYRRDGYLKHTLSRKCLTYSGDSVKLKICSGLKTQHWDYPAYQHAWKTS